MGGIYDELTHDVTQALDGTYRVLLVIEWQLGLLIALTTLQIVVIFLRKR